MDGGEAAALRWRSGGREVEERRGGRFYALEARRLRKGETDDALSLRYQQKINSVMTEERTADEIYKEEPTADE
ncbi:hypothetical protein F511_14170 [Dorcoceras hygrometricum]|uniref:Uncharacterized protein n=1 Tax=Dorcoceras hygrometricum TaxID=472368 RepID=A0A2Z7D065_9LAMI|nr:hypothetical protein F511_14170 [Dorcoceras hygrometricum]